MSRRRISSGSSCWYLVGQKPQQVQKRERPRERQREETRTYRRVGSLHRDAQGEDEQGHGELSQLAPRVFIHLRGINQGSVRVNTRKLCSSLLACHSPVVHPLPRAHLPSVKQKAQGGKRDFFSACRLLLRSQRLPVFLALAPCASAVPPH